MQSFTFFDTTFFCLCALRTKMAVVDTPVAAPFLLNNFRTLSWIEGLEGFTEKESMGTRTMRTGCDLHRSGKYLWRRCRFSLFVVVGFLLTAN
jgi:hypothetical protein